MKPAAVYVRVSTKKQDHRSQLLDLERWASIQDTEPLWFKDKASGKAESRPGWDRLWAAVERGEVGRIVCWRLDRLGRSTRGLSKLFAELQSRGINLLSLRESLDLGTASGRLVCHIMASVAQFELELRSERQRAGIAAARAAGKVWGGSRKGRRLRVTPEAAETIARLKAEGKSIAAIARATGLSRPTVYAVLRCGTES